MPWKAIVIGCSGVGRGRRGGGGGVSSPAWRTTAKPPASASNAPPPSGTQRRWRPPTANSAHAAGAGEAIRARGGGRAADRDAPRAAGVGQVAHRASTRTPAPSGASAASTASRSRAGSTTPTRARSCARRAAAYNCVAVTARFESGASKTGKGVIGIPFRLVAHFEQRDASPGAGSSRSAIATGSRTRCRARVAWLARADACGEPGASARPQNEPDTEAKRHVICPLPALRERPDRRDPPPDHGQVEGGDPQPGDDSPCRFRPARQCDGKDARPPQREREVDGHGATKSTAVRFSWGSTMAPAARVPSSTSSPRASVHSVEGRPGAHRAGEPCGERIRNEVTRQSAEHPGIVASPGRASLPAVDRRRASIFFSTRLFNPLVKSAVNAGLCRARDRNPRDHRTEERPAAGAHPSDG